MTRREFFARTIGALVAAVSSPSIAAVCPMSYAMQFDMDLTRITFDYNSSWQDGYLADRVFAPVPITIEGYWDDEVNK